MVPRFGLVLLIAIPAIAYARPKVAVAPLEGDDDNKVSLVIAEAAADHAKVTGPDKVSREMNDLGVSSLSSKSLKKLRGKLEVDVVIHGKVDKDGSKKHVALTLSGKGKTKAMLELDFKSTKTLKKELGKELGKKLEVATGAGNDDEADDDEAPKRPFGDDTAKKDDEDRKKKSDDEDRKKRDDEDRKKKADEEDRKKRVASEETRARKRSDDDDEGSGKKKRKHRRDEDDSESPPLHPVTQAALWLDAGAAAARRSLTYDGSGTGAPLPVGTADLGGQLSGEVYLAALGGSSGALSGFGLFASFSKTIGLSITVPGTTESAAIDEAAYEAGARYRFKFGQSSLAVGASYWRRYYIADRTTLMKPDDLDMPDTSYVAVAPGAILRFATSPTIGGFVSADVPLLMASGSITGSQGFGKGQAIAFDVDGGVQIIVTPHYALQLAAQFSQVGFSFAAMVRGVSAATDRSIGLAATLGVLY